MFFGVICGDSKKTAKMELPKGGGHAIRRCLRMFRKGGPLSLWLHFHFGVSLGAKFATILLLGRPGGQTKVTKQRLKKKVIPRAQPHIGHGRPGGGSK